ncbi:MAG: MFS transporter [Thermodesulfobacteriota bacterium]
MVSTLSNFFGLFTAVFIMLMGVGSLSTLLSLRMTMAGFSAQLTGLIMATYFLGLVFGSFVCQPLIHRVGHIRSFAAFAAVATAVVMMHGLYLSAPFWAFLRFVSGIITIGLYMVIESWLNECAVPGSRGRVFSIYMICSYLGMGLGQQILNVGDPQGLELFLVIGILLSLCLVPVAVTHSVHPELPPTEKFNLIALIKQSPMGMMGSFVAGITNSSFYAMGPVFGNQIGLSVSAVAGMMTLTIFGGLACQWPVGLLSDRFDRALILSWLGILVALIAGGMMFTAGISYRTLVVIMAVFGGIIFAVYPVAVSRAHDVSPSHDVVAISSALLLCYGVGSSIGPIAASAFMTAFQSPYALFGFCACIGILYAVLGFFLRQMEMLKHVPLDEQVDFFPMKNTSQVAHALDPRGSLEADVPVTND